MNGPLAQGDLDGPGQLFAVERHPVAAPLHDHQFAHLDALESRETRTALQARPAAPDGGVILRRPAVAHLGVGDAAIWTAHDLRPFKPAPVEPGAFPQSPG